MNEYTARKESLYRCFRQQKGEVENDDICRTEKLELLGIVVALEESPCADSWRNLEQCQDSAVAKKKRSVFDKNSHRAVVLNSCLKQVLEVQRCADNVFRALDSQLGLQQLEKLSNKSVHGTPQLQYLSTPEMMPELLSTNFPYFAGLTLPRIAL